MRLAELEQEKRGVAESIATEAEVVQRCPDHDHMLVRGAAEPGAAFALGQRKFEGARLQGVFDSAKEMRAMLQSVIDDAGNDCEACALRDED